jgi:carboxyl-terminal processing protease
MLGMSTRKKYLKVGLLLSWLLAVGAAFAVATEVPVSELKPDASHRQAALIITKVVDRFHYRKVPLDDALAADILDRYLRSLDPNRSFFSARDVEEFGVHRNTLDDALSRADLKPAFDIFKRFRSRVDERVGYAVKLLEANQFDFERDERYRFDREKADWEADRAALDDLWRKRVKNDILSLRLAGKDEADIIPTLRKRYEGIARRVHQFNSEDVFQFFINAYTLNIEPHTSYMSPRSSENFDISMRLSLQGIGAVLRSDNEFTLVQSTVPGGPANSSGQLHAGDRIVGVAQGDNGEMEDVVGWRLQDVVDLIRGPKDSVVRLNTVAKKDGPNGVPRVVRLVRDEIKLEDQAAKGSVVDDLPGLHGKRIGVIEIPAFYRDFRGQSEGDPDFRSTTRDVRRILADLQAKGVEGIVIDLRQNGGGALTEATELTGLFIEQGPVVQVRDSDGNVDIERDTDPQQVYRGPLAVLVDRNSASASEIFAGAIQDYKRGLIIGEPTYGKGTVQTLVDLSRFVRGDTDLGRLRLTMAQFFRVNGGSTQHRGVMPDIVFPTARSAADHGERALEKALPWAAIDPVLHDTSHISALAGLRESHQRRISQDPGFRYLREQEQEFAELEQQDSLSLREDQRRGEWQAREQARLDRLNRLRSYRGLQPLAALLDEDELEAQTDDQRDEEGVARIMLDESVRILADYIASAEPRTAQAR